MVQKTGQTLQPCVQFDNVILADVDGEELQDYLDEHEFKQVAEGDPNVPLDRSCTDAEHESMRKQATNGGSQPHIPIKDTGFYGAR